jgi:CRP/FNR family nitrogen fixation transcriptional regulator
MHTAAQTEAHRPITAPSLGTIQGLSRHQHPILSFSADSEVYAQGESAGDLFRIEFGAVRIYRLLADGRRQVVAFHLAGETFGFEAGHIHSFFAEAMVHSGIRILDRPANQQTSPDLMLLALQGLIRAQEHLLVVGRQNAMERIAAFFMDMMERQGDLENIELPMSRLDIGDYLGLTIETVSRTFAKFREEGIIRLLSTRSVEILRPEKLRLLCR